MGKFKDKLIGSRSFYKMVLSIAIPIMVQNGFTQFVNLLDNIMVGRVGTEAMSGVSIANQLIFVFNLCIFGGMSGAGIFTSQYFGAKNNKGVEHSLRYKIYLSIILFILASILLILFPTPLVNLFLSGSSDGGDLALTRESALSYIRIMLIGLPFFAIGQAYSTTLRESGETKLPMKAGIAAVLTNLLFNYLLIFGKFGFPSLGVSGAAIATVISRIVETSIVVIYSHHNKERFPFFSTLYKSFKIPKSEVKRITKAALPLLFNETMWSLGMSFMAQCYSLRGLNAIASYNISSTISNLTNVVFLAMGNSIGIIVGHLLGEGKEEEAVDTDRKMIFFSLVLCIIVGIITIAFSPLFPKIYNTNESVRSIASGLIFVQGIFLPIFSFKSNCYYTLRSGGMVFITILFDSVMMWLLSIPVAFILSRFTTLSVIAIFFFTQSCDILKCILGFILVKKRVWVKNIAKDNIVEEKC